METKYALLLLVSEELRDGDDGIFAELAVREPLFDRHEEIAVFSTKEQARNAGNLLLSSGIVPEQIEHLELLLLSAPVFTAPTFDDFGFFSRMGHAYVYKELVSVFRITGVQLRSACLQLEEHAIARIGADSLHPATGRGEPDDARIAAEAGPAAAHESGVRCYAIETQFHELAEGIAKAYGCTLEWLTGQVT